MAQNTESVVAKPLVFNGSLSSYPTWRRSLGLYMTFNSTKFPDDQSKVICALSYMTEKTASVWAQAFMRRRWTPLESWQWEPGQTLLSD